MTLPKGFILDDDSDVDNEATPNLPKGFILDSNENNIATEEDKQWKGHDTKRFIRPLGRAVKKEGWGALKHIPAAAASFAEDIQPLVRPELLAMSMFSRQNQGLPKLSDVIRGEQEGLTEEEKTATKAAEELLKLLIPIPLGGKIEAGLERAAPKIKPPKIPKLKRPQPPDLGPKEGLIPDLYELIFPKERFSTSDISKSLEPEFQAIRKEVSALPKVKTKVSPEFVKEKLPIISPEKSKALEAKRVSFDKDPLSKVITKEGYKGALPEAETTSNIIKKSSKESRKPFEEAYKQAEEIYTNQSLTRKEQGNLIEKTDQIIDNLELITKRNPGEEVVYQHARAIKSMLGSHEGHIVPKNQLSRLIKQSDSMSAVANYDMPYIGYKGVLKKMSKNLNESVINSLEQQGLNAKPFIKADKLYGQWAETYLNDEISPFLEKRIANPEALYSKTIKDPGTYRNIKKIVGKKDPALMKRYNKSIIESKLGKYTKDKKLIGSKGYNNDIIDLKNVIGSEDTLKVDKYLKGLKKQTEITEKIPKIKPKETVESAKLRTLSEKPKFKYKNLTEIRKQFKTGEGIKELKTEFKRIKQEPFFNKMAKQHMDDMLREGNVIGKKATGNNLSEILSKRDNYEVFSELLGEKEVQNIIIEAKIEGHKKLTKDIVKKITKGIVKTAIGGKFLKILLKCI